MGLTHVTVTMRSLRYLEPPYEAEFLVESVGILVDPTTKTLKRLPAVPPK